LGLHSAQHLIYDDFPPLFQYTGYFATVLKAVWGNQEELIELLGKSTAYIERSNLTTRLFNACLTRETLAFSKDVEFHEAAVTWKGVYYNWVRPHKSLRRETSDDPQRKRTSGLRAWLPT
jgi:hypothetical protein